MTKIFILTSLISFVGIQGCKTYFIDKDFAARQMTDLKIKKRNRLDLDVSTGKSYGGKSYSTDLEYLVVKNQSSSFDTISPFDIKFFLKSGVNSGYVNPLSIIFKGGFFINFDDTTLKTNPKCKFCKINIDSIEKIVIRGPRLSKKNNK